MKRWRNGKNSVQDLLLILLYIQFEKYHLIFKTNDAFQYPSMKWLTTNDQFKFTEQYYTCQGD